MFYEFFCTCDTFNMKNVNMGARLSCSQGRRSDVSGGSKRSLLSRALDTHRLLILWLDVGAPFLGWVGKPSDLAGPLCLPPGLCPLLQGVPLQGETENPTNPGQSVDMQGLRGGG